VTASYYNSGLKSSARWPPLRLITSPIFYRVGLRGIAAMGGAELPGKLQLTVDQVHRDNRHIMPVLDGV